MKYRCPYCKTLSDGELRAQCRFCGKTMSIPDRLRTASGHRERKKVKEQIRREAERQRKAIFVPDLPLGRKPSSLLAVLAVMALVGGLLAVRARTRFAPSRKRAPVEVARKELRVLSAAVELFRGDCSRYPRTGEGLQALINNPGASGWGGPYVSLIRPDPWGRHYVYRCDGTNRILFSCGPDGAAATPDDLSPPPTDDKPLPR